MAFGERCPACGHMPGEETDRALLDMTIAWAVDLTRQSTTPGHSGEEIAERLRTLHNALLGLSRVEKPADPPA